MISRDEKNIFLQDLEEEAKKEDEIKKQKEEINKEIEEEELEEDKKEEEKKTVKKKSKKKVKKKSHTVALFAAGFIFFIFIIILLIFMLSLAEGGNPIFVAFAVEPYEIKAFLKGLVNKIFMGVVITLLLLLAVGLFRGYSLPKEEKQKRRGSFIFGGVSGGLIFLSILAWGGAIAFIDKFATEGIGKAKIEILGFQDDEQIIAPIDIEFSAKSINTQFKRQGKKIIGFRWSKDGGKKFSPSSLNTSNTFQFFQKGIQTINLEVELLSGEVEKYKRSFIIDDATFLMNPERVSQGKKVEFNASSLFKGNALYLWDFDNDGIFDKRTRSSKTTTIFNEKGEETVKLRIEADNDSIEKYSRTFIVSADNNKSVDANISINKGIEGKAPYEVTFDASDSYSEYDDINSYIWSIGKSKIQKKGVTITHIFEKEGIYPVTLTVKGENNRKDSEEIIITVEKGNSPPNAIIKTKPPLNNSSKKLTGFIPLEVQFYGAKSTDADENIVQYKWIIRNKDDDEEEFFGDEMSQIFRSEGTYTVILRVSDREGESDEFEMIVDVKEPPVVPIVSIFPESGTSPLIVEFNASQSTCKLDNCKILSYEWDFDDGKKPVQAGAFIQHQFTKPGTYEVETTAITNLGERASTISYISLTEQPFVACFRPSRKSGSAPLIVSFDPNTCSKGEIVKYQWDFGDGFISGKRNPTHTYATAGEYTAILHTFDKNGRVSEMKEIITVSPKKKEQ